MGGTLAAEAKTKSDHVHKHEAIGVQTNQHRKRKEGQTNKQSNSLYMRRKAQVLEAMGSCGLCAKHMGAAQSEEQWSNMLLLRVQAMRPMAMYETEISAVSRTEVTLPPLVVRIKQTQVFLEARSHDSKSQEREITLQA